MGLVSFFSRKSDAPTANESAPYLLKPIQPDDVRIRVARIVELRRLQQRLAFLAGIVESSDDAIVSTTLEGIITSWNGPGLTSEEIAHVFDPFFTTKIKGIGLGLAIAKRIVEAHGGVVSLDRRGDAGTAIAIHLPRTGPPILA